MIVVTSNADTEKQEPKKTKYDLNTSSEYDTKDTIDDKFDQTSKSLIQGIPSQTGESILAFREGKCHMISKISFFPSLKAKLLFLV